MYSVVSSYVNVVILKAGDLYISAYNFLASLIGK